VGGFDVGELVASIRLDGIDAYNRGLDQAEQRLRSTDVQSERTSSRLNSMMTGAAALTTAATVALGAYIAGLARVGLEYNQLQQTSRAALNAILGSTEAVNEQMAQLDAFAATSPFAKSVFITAQQQMLGFGIEARKVIPYLDAIQNTTAAIGGNNQTVAELTFIMAQISAAGKITGQDLIQFGQRGVNAAELIGSQMGKTGAQIRADITAGALDANDALDALAAAMQERYGAAAENVKNTIVGATDRIKAASRDIGALLAAPFVDPQGGGYFVTWGNQVADNLRQLQRLTGPIVEALERRALPAIVGITRGLDSMRVQLNAVSVDDLERGFSRLAEHAPAVGALAGAVFGLSTNMLNSIPVIGTFARVFAPIPTALAAAALASPELRDALGGLLEELRPLLTIVGRVAALFSDGLNVAIPIATGVVRALAVVVGPIVDLLTAIPAPVLAAVAAFVGMNRVAPQVLGFFRDARFAVTHFLGQMGLLQGQTAMVGASLATGATQAGLFSRAVSAAGNALKAAFVSNPVGLIVTALATAVGLLTWAFTANAEAAREQQERVDALKGTLTETSGEVTRATQKMVTDALRPAAEGFALIGSSAEAAGQAVTGSARQQAALLEAIRLRAQDLGDAYRAQAEAAGGATKLSGDVTRAYYAESEALRQARDAVIEQAEAINAAREQRRAEIEMVREYQRSLDDAARSNARLNESVEIARDAYEDAGSRLRALNQALDELSGGSRSAAQAERDLNEQTDRLAAAFSETDSKGRNLARRLVDASGAIDTTSVAGRRMFDTVDGLNTQMQQALIEADRLAKANGEVGLSFEEANAVAAPYIDSLREVGREAGLSDEQIEGMIGKMLAVPTTVSFLLTDNGSISENDQALLSIVNQLQTIPTGTIRLQNQSPEVLEALRELGFTVEELPEGEVEITSNDEAIGAALDILSKKIEELPPGVVEVETDGVPEAERELNHLARDRVAVIRTRVEQANGGVVVPRADGGIHSVGRVVPAASGRLREPQIVPGGSNILWGEPETFEEAYISRKPAARARNEAILDRVAGWFGGEYLPEGEAGRASMFRGGDTFQATFQLAPVPGLSPEAQALRAADALMVKTAARRLRG